MNELLKRIIDAAKEIFAKKYRYALPLSLIGIGVSMYPGYIEGIVRIVDRVAASLPFKEAAAPAEGNASSDHVESSKSCDWAGLEGTEYVLAIMQEAVPLTVATIIISLGLFLAVKRFLGDISRDGEVIYKRHATIQVVAGESFADAVDAFSKAYGESILLVGFSEKEKSVRLTEGIVAGNPTNLGAIRDYVDTGELPAFGVKASSGFWTIRKIT